MKVPELLHAGDIRRSCSGGGGTGTVEADCEEP